jgi:hypothetical protein
MPLSVNKVSGAIKKWKYLYIQLMNLVLDCLGLSIFFKPKQHAGQRVR